MAMTSYDDWQKEREQLREEIRRLKEENALPNKVMVWRFKHKVMHGKVAEHVL